MKIYLLNGHEAVVMDDRAACVTVEPFTKGVLSVEGKGLSIESGVTASPCMTDMVGAVHATFTTSTGIRYKIVSPYVTEGRLHSRVDPMRGYIENRMYTDRLEKRLEQAEAEIRRIKGNIRHDALGFLIKEEE